jgi:uncharacterized protein (DUF58 family)
MAVVHLNDGKVFAAAHFLFSPFPLVQGVLWVLVSFFSTVLGTSFLRTLPDLKSMPPLRERAI